MNYEQMTDAELDKERVSINKKITELKVGLRQVVGLLRKRELIAKAKEDSKSMTPEQREAVAQTILSTGIKSGESFGKANKK